MLSFLSLVFLAASAVHQAAAHGTVVAINIDGTVYKGIAAGDGPNPSTSPIRLVANNGPVKGASNPDLACGLGGAAGKPAAFVAPAKAGSQIAFDWKAGSGDTNWVHNVGPMMTYIAECEGTTCDKFDASNAKWVKINQAGQKADGSGWYQADISAFFSLIVCP